MVPDSKYELTLLFSLVEVRKAGEKKQEKKKKKAFPLNFKGPFML